MTITLSSNGVFDLTTNDSDEINLAQGLGFMNTSVGVYSSPDPTVACAFAPMAQGDAVGALSEFWFNYQTSYGLVPVPGWHEVPSKEGNELYPYQQLAAQLSSRRTHMLMAHPPGLGKTPIAIAKMNWFRPNRVLIVCPGFLALNWQVEIEKWLHYYLPIDTILRPKLFLRTEPSITILPYSRVGSYFSSVMNSEPYDLVVFDETHFLKNAKAARTRYCFGTGHTQGIVHRGKSSMMLSGTPLPADPRDMFPMFRAIGGGVLPESYQRFAQMFCNIVKIPGVGREVARPLPTSAIKLNMKLRASGFMVRPKKEDALPQLPNRVTNMVFMEETSQVTKLVAEEVRLYEAWQNGSFSDDDITDVKGHIMQVRAELAGTKVRTAAAVIQDLFDQGEKRVLAFGCHINLIEGVAEILGKNIKVSKIYGRQTDERGVSITGEGLLRERQRIVEQFQDTSQAAPHLIIGHPRSMGVGLTLTAARMVVMMELDWTPDVNTQAVERTHRIGQVNQVTATILSYKNSVDRRVLQRNEEKAVFSDAALDLNITERYE